MSTMKADLTHLPNLTPQHSRSNWIFYFSRGAYKLLERTIPSALIMESCVCGVEHRSAQEEDVTEGTPDSSYTLRTLPPSHGLPDAHTSDKTSSKEATLSSPGGSDTPGFRFRFITPLMGTFGYRLHTRGQRSQTIGYRSHRDSSTTWLVLEGKSDKLWSQETREFIMFICARRHNPSFSGSRCQTVWPVVAALWQFYYFCHTGTSPAQYQQSESESTGRRKGNFASSESASGFFSSKEETISL
ncbi:hypothetical protein Bbelb_098460 [Branchiostoma belcheri]|nr:hypothetical protein Bbelb_098460 [Branchiostoma belcheri]